MTAPVLKVEGLHAAAQLPDGGERPIVTDISFAVSKGEILGLIGESGAGKSTLGLAALGYARSGYRFTQGRVVLHGQDLLTLHPNALRDIRGVRVAYVPQSAAAAFNPAKTLLTQVAEGPVRHGLLSSADATKRAVELFDELNLPDPEQFGKRYPHQASGGQLQRAAMAMAMACRPDLLVLDEPTTALDVTTQVDVLVSIRRLIEHYGTAALYISHDLPVVAQMATRMVVLRHGRIVETGETRALLATPREDYTRQLVAARDKKQLERAALPPAPLLRVRNLFAAYRDGNPVVSNISFAVRRGQTLAVVGESGSGKSSLARSICGLLPAHKGSITFDDTILPRLNADRNLDQRRRIQMVMQSPDTSLNPYHSVQDIIGRPLRLYFGHDSRRIAEEVAELLIKVDLDPTFAKRKPAALSGGQKQRVSIARALAAEPDLMICDEATAALDPLVAEGVLALLDRLQRTLGIAYIFITHDVNIVQRIAHDVIVMEKGKIVDHGVKASVLAQPTSLYTRRLLKAVPEMNPAWLDAYLAEKRPQGK